MGMELVGACSPEMCEWLHCLAQWHRRRADTVLQGRPSAYIFYTNLYAHGQIHDLEPGAGHARSGDRAIDVSGPGLGHLRQQRVVERIEDVEGGAFERIDEFVVDEQLSLELRFVHGHS